VLAGDTIERAAAAFFVLNGLVSVVSAFATALNPGWVTTGIGFASFATWNILIVAMMVLMLLAMRRRLRKGSEWLKVTAE
jgi:hypothetical protein